MCMCVHLRSSMEPRRWQWMPFSITLFFIFFSGNRVVQLSRNSSIQLCRLANGCQRSICLCALRAEIADNHCPPWSCPHLKNSHLDNWIISPALKMFPLVPVLNPEHRRVLCPPKKKKWRMNRAENREREGARHGRLHCRPLSLKYAELGKGAELPRWYNVIITLNYFNRNTKAFGYVTGMVKSYWTRRSRLLSSCN